RGHEECVLRIGGLAGIHLHGLGGLAREPRVLGGVGVLGVGGVRIGGLLEHRDRLEVLVLVRDLHRAATDELPVAAGIDAAAGFVLLVPVRRDPLRADRHGARTEPSVYDASFHFPPGFAPWLSVNWRNWSDSTNACARNTDCASTVSIFMTLKAWFK